MNRNALLAAIAVAILALLAAGTLVRPTRDVHTSAPSSPSTAPEDTEIPGSRVSRFAKGAGQASTRTHPRNTALPNASTTQPLRQRRPLTGFIVDDFRTWTYIPKGYYAEGVRVGPAGLQLDDSPTSGSRTGVLQSPPLELWQPVLSAPAEPAALPEGAEVRAQISLSPDGHTWSDWKSIERHTRPDGNQVMPNEPPRWSGGPPAPQALATDNAQTSGPYIRYRLTLTSPSSDSPVIQDLRIWRNSQLSQD
jgi:hypothetical protein